MQLKALRSNRALWLWLVVGFVVGFAFAPRPLSTDAPAQPQVPERPVPTDPIECQRALAQTREKADKRRETRRTLQERLNHLSTEVERAGIGDPEGTRMPWPEDMGSRASRPRVFETSDRGQGSVSRTACR